MLSIKSIKLPSIHVDFLLLCSCQVSSHSEYFIIIYVSLTSHVGGKTPISDHREGQRDFLLAINLSSLVGVRLDVIQSSDVKEHFGFPGNRLPSMTKLRVMFVQTISRKVETKVTI